MGQTRHFGEVHSLDPVNPQKVGVYTYIPGRAQRMEAIALVIGIPGFLLLATLCAAFTIAPSTSGMFLVGVNGILWGSVLSYSIVTASTQHWFTLAYKIDADKFTRVTKDGQIIERSWHDLRKLHISSSGISLTFKDGLQLFIWRVPSRAHNDLIQGATNACKAANLERSIHIQDTLAIRVPWFKHVSQADDQES